MKGRQLVRTMRFMNRIKTSSKTKSMIFSWSSYWFGVQVGSLKAGFETQINMVDLPSLNQHAFQFQYIQNNNQLIQDFIDESIFIDKNDPKNKKIYLPLRLINDCDKIQPGKVFSISHFDTKTKGFDVQMKQSFIKQVFSWFSNDEAVFKEYRQTCYKDKLNMEIIQNQLVQLAREYSLQISQLKSGHESQAKLIKDTTLQLQKEIDTLNEKRQQLSIKMGKDIENSKNDLENEYNQQQEQIQEKLLVKKTDKEIINQKLAQIQNDILDGEETLQNEQSTINDDLTDIRNLAKGSEQQQLIYFQFNYLNRQIVEVENAINSQDENQVYQSIEDITGVIIKKRQMISQKLKSNKKQINKVIKHKKLLKNY